MLATVKPVTLIATKPVAGGHDRDGVHDQIDVHGHCPLQDRVDQGPVVEPRRRTRHRAGRRRDAHDGVEAACRDALPDQPLAARLRQAGCIVPV